MRCLSVFMNILIHKGEREGKKEEEKKKEGCQFSIRVIISLPHFFKKYCETQKWELVCEYLPSPSAATYISSQLKQITMHSHNSMHLI